MIQEKIEWAAEAMNGTVQREGTGKEFRGVSTDTRELAAGELFFCLIAAKDGHQFAGEAISKGASGIVIDRAHSAIMGPLYSSVPFILVDDTLTALGDLASAWRRRLSIPVLAIGGSNGKTTTKELIRAVLETRFKVLATEVNLNNLIGVPKTLFNLNPGHEVAVIEAGMNSFGELARLTEIIQPTAALLTNIGLEHLEKLGDLEGVAKAEGELFAGLSEEATALVNLADPYIPQLPTPAIKEFYGTPSTPVWGKVLSTELKAGRPLHLELHLGDDRAQASLLLAGAHNLSNALAALAVARHLGIALAPAVQALESFTPSHSRMELVELKAGSRLIDDCYNANPSSIIASLKTLAQLRDKGKTLAILGEMLELGEYAKEGHRQVGEAAAAEKIDYLIAIGPHADFLLKAAREGGISSASLQGFADTDQALKAMQKLPEQVRWILVKGSRGAHLEKIVDHLKENF